MLVVKTEKSAENNENVKKQLVTELGNSVGVRDSNLTFDETENQLTSQQT